MTIFRNQIDLKLPDRALTYFRMGLGFLCLYEFLFRLVFVEQLNEFSPIEIVRDYLSTTYQDGWSHLLFYAGKNIWYSNMLFIIGIMLSLAVIFKKCLLASQPLLAFFWLNLCYRYPFLSHGGDTIVFFSLVILSIISLQQKQGGRSLHFLLFLQFGLVMFFAGLNKMNSSWLGGGAVELALKYDSFSYFNSIPENLSGFFSIISVVTPFFEMALPFLFIFRGTRQLGSLLTVSFAAVLILFFSSGLLAASIALYGLLFWPFKGNSLAQASAVANKNYYITMVSWLYVFLSVSSSFSNLRIFDSQTSLLKKLEEKYYLEQNWSYMTNPIADFLKIRITSSANNGAVQTYVIKSWIHNWSTSEITNSLLIHRRAIFFKHLFWNKHNDLIKIFTSLYCKKINSQNQKLEFELFLSDKKIIKTFETTCPLKEGSEA